MAEGDMNEEADADSVAMDDAVEPEMMDEGDAAAPASEAEEPAAEPQPEEGDDQ